jgi:hypothetical protein
MTTWSIDYEKDTIAVERKGPKKVLTVNGTEQDVKDGVLYSTLEGKTTACKAIKVKIDSGRKEDICVIFIDGQEVLNEKQAI